MESTGVFWIPVYNLQEIGGRLCPFDFELELLDTIPGIGRQTAELILAEIGTDMSRFRIEWHTERPSATNIPG